MKNLLLLLMIALSAVVGNTQAQAQDPPRHADRHEIGRYQLVASLDGHLFMLDTATGQCWSRGREGQWRDEGNPVQMGPGRQAETLQQPTQLKLPTPSLEMTINQREEYAIPGSNETIRVRLADITEGQVHIAVVTSDGGVLVERTSVAQGDRVEFKVGEKLFVLKVDELHNVLVGNDFAQITIAEMTDSSPAEIPPAASGTPRGSGGN